MCFSQVQKKDTVFFLSGLEDDIYGKVLDVMEKYGRLELKGQRATKKKFDRQVSDKHRLSQLPFQAPARRPDKRRDDGTSLKCRGRKHDVCWYDAGSQQNEGN